MSEPAPALHDEVLAAIRQTVRELLESNPAYDDVGPELRRRLAQALVTISARGAGLLAEERELDAEIARRAPARGPGQALAAAQSAGDQLGLQAARNAGATIEGLKKAIDFPQFVQSLISGVFEAITRSNMHQLEALGDLLDSISVASDDFTDANVTDAAATAWALQKLPFLTAGPNGLAVRDGVDMSQQGGALRAALGPDGESVDASDLAGSLLPLAKKKMGQSRQSTLATMVQMGLQRIVVDQGQLHASMDMRVDTSSVSTENKGEQSDYRVNAGAQASMGMGLWGASAYVNTSIGKVESDQQYTQEQLASRAGLRSSVDLAFRTEQIPLDRMADEKARVKLNLAARVPADVDSGPSLLQNAPVATAAPSMPMSPAPGAPSAAPAASKPASDAKPAAAAKPAAGAKPAAAAKPAAKPATDDGAAGKAQPAAQPSS
jgi:hypothetical protein